MAQVHAFNGTTINGISSAPWDQPQVNTSMALIGVHNRRRRLTWTANVLSAATFKILEVKEGSLVQLTTPPPGDPNGSYVTYYAVEVMSVTGRHVGLNFENVIVEFLVRT